ncbi:M24 family metallopeptidase [Williamsia sterculiae]|uniref:M24 family metallopeptidase n=1 Tax=Williamsia sterculiae TaxID=1344003 RepID=UPI0009712781|nr:aminopeptidase P family protein [Williamsia sterculiae]
MDSETTVPHAARRDRLRALLTGEGVQTLVVSDLINVRYLSGFTGSNAALLIDAAGPDDDRICTDGRYITQVGEQSPDLTAVIARDCAAELVALAAEQAPVIGFEAHVVTVEQCERLRERLFDTRPEADLRGVGRLVEDLRMVKDPGEVELLRMACQAADVALAAIIERGLLAPGRTEREVARALEWEMYARGADEISFETIVAAGANSAVPHHRPTDAVLASGDLVKIDFGAVVDGYHSDMTRTYVLDHASEWQREIYELVAEAQRAGREALSPGADLRAVDAAARDVIDGAGFGDQYVHGLGHGVGLEIHEAPGIGKLAAGTLPERAAVTVEPGIYLPGRGGVRIEDTLVVTAAGHRPELLTMTDKAFTIV